MLNDTDQPISSVDDVIAYLFEALRNMRDYPLEDEFQEGYERAYNDVMYHLIAQGRCPPADIFIVLPQDAMGDAVLDDIKADMPGIQVRPWDFALDAPREKKPRIGSSHSRLIDYMTKRDAGTVSLSAVQHDLQLISVKKLRETLNNEEPKSSDSSAGSQGCLWERASANRIPATGSAQGSSSGMIPFLRAQFRTPWRQVSHLLMVAAEMHTVPG